MENPFPSSMHLYFDSWLSSYVNTLHVKLILFIHSSPQSSFPQIPNSGLETRPLPPALHLAWSWE